MFWYAPNSLEQLVMQAVLFKFKNFKFVQLVHVVADVHVLQFGIKIAQYSHKLMPFTIVFVESILKKFLILFILKSGKKLI